MLTTRPDCSQRLLFVVALTASSAALAANTEVPKEDAVFKLGTMMVYGQAPGPADTLQVGIKAEEIGLLEKRNVAEALATLPGVTLTQFGGRNEASVYVRGFGRNQTPLFIDGVPAYVPYDGYVDLGRFTTYDVASIEVAKGYSSVLFGPNTLGGAINLVSRRPQDTLEGQLQAGVFSGDGSEGSLNVGTRQHLWYAQLRTSYVERDTFPLSKDFTPVKAENGGDRENADSRDTKVSAKVAFTPNQTDEYAFGISHQEGEKGNPPYTGTNASMLKYWRWPRWDKQTLYYISNTRLGEEAYLKPRLYYDWYDNALDQYKDASYTTLLSGSSAPSAYADHAYGGSIEGGTAAGLHHSVKAAAYYKLDHHDEKIEKQPHYLYEDETWSLALEDNWQITTDWLLQLGASYDTRKALRADQVNPNGTPVALTQFDSLNPQAGLFYKSSSKDTWHGTVSRKSRFPTIKDRYSYKFNTAFPNPSLEPEAALHYELGYVGQAAPGLAVNASIYVSEIDDAIINVSYVNGTNRSQNQNAGRVENYGTDLGADYVFRDWLRAGGSYTYLHQENLTNPAIKATDTPLHNGLLYCDLRPVNWLSLIPSLSSSSWRYADSTGKKLAGFTTFGLKVSLRLPRGVTASVGVANVSDKAYALQDGYPEQGRSVYANLRYLF